MEPLDLSKAPPRSPRERLDGLVMLPRTIDKLRATLPGGNPGEYKIPGFSERMLQTIGVEEAQLREAVRTAATDQEVAAWVRAHALSGKYEEANRLLISRTLGDVSDRAAFEKRYPVARGLPDDTPLYEVIERDDAATFKESCA